MSPKKVRNATEVPFNKISVLMTLFSMYDAANNSIVLIKCDKMQAVNKVFSLDREAFPSLNGLPGETLHSVRQQLKLVN